MSDIKTTLIELVRYYNSNRGVGHTAAMLTGAQNMGECLVVAANQADADKKTNAARLEFLSRQGFGSTVLTGPGLWGRQSTLGA